MCLALGLCPRGQARSPETTGMFFSGNASDSWQMGSCSVVRLNILMNDDPLFPCPFADTSCRSCHFHGYPASSLSTHACPSCSERREVSAYASKACRVSSRKGIQVRPTRIPDCAYHYAPPRRLSRRKDIWRPFPRIRRLPCASLRPRGLHGQDPGITAQAVQHPCIPQVWVLLEIYRSRLVHLHGPVEQEDGNGPWQVNGPRP